MKETKMPGVFQLEEGELKERRFIVAEISKNYLNGMPAFATPPLSIAFEEIVNVNAQRGFRLVQFQLHRMMVNATDLNETIIAVFENVALSQSMAVRAPENPFLLKSET